MKIQIFTEEKYGKYLIGEYEFIPQNNLDYGEQISFPLSEILDEMPTTFVKMQTLLTEMDEEYRNCVDKFTDMTEKYMKHDCYRFEHENHGVSPYAQIIVVNNSCEFRKNTLTSRYYVPENGTLNLIIKPLKCTICRTDKSFVNPVKVSSGIIMNCLNCMERTKQNRQTYEKKKKLADYYEKWNQFLCDKCESLGYECSMCRASH